MNVFPKREPIGGIIKPGERVIRARDGEGLDTVERIALQDRRNEGQRTR
ncbi:hypothetical protein N182_37310 [Sinorhizobium sp. GL2]|nr:hypothetical protein N182_37310 [Sinorhizobium sp. GL2]